MSINFKNVLPSEFEISQPLSTSKSILRKNLMEILPTESGVFRPSSSTRISFRIASNSDFFLGSESYIRFRLRRTDHAQYNTFASLDEGGVHALFKHIEVKNLATGGVIQRYEEYADYACLKSNTQQSPLDVQMGASYGDSMSDRVHCDPYQSGGREALSGTFNVSAAGALTGTNSLILEEMKVGDRIHLSKVALTFDLATATYATATKIWTLPSGNATSALAVGDVLTFLSNQTNVSVQLVVVEVTSDTSIKTSSTLSADVLATQVLSLSHASLSYFETRINSITSNTAATVSPAPPAAISKAIGLREIMRELLPARNENVFSYGAESSGTASQDHIIEFKPLVSCFYLNLPLFLMRGGIEITFTLQPAYRALKSGLSVAGSDQPLNYQITEPRLMAMFATPHSDVVDDYVSQWKTDTGLIYEMPSVVFRKVSGITGEQNQNILMHPGARSARKIYTMIKDSKLTNDDAALCRQANSISTWLRSNVSEYQYKIGGRNFPNRPVVCDTYSTEALEHLKLVSASPQFRFSPDDWYSVNPIVTGAGTAVVNESKKFVMCADLSRDNGPHANVTGEDVSTVPIQLDITRSAVYQAGYTGVPEYWSFIEIDSYLKLSQSQVAVMN